MIDIFKDVFQINGAQYEMYQGNHDISLNTMQQHIHYVAYFEIPREIKEQSLKTKYIWIFDFV